MRDAWGRFAFAALLNLAAFLLTMISCSTNTDLADTTPPASVTDLAVIAQTPNSVTLRWTAPEDEGATGSAAQYDVRYATWPISSSNWEFSPQAPDEPKPKRAGQMDTLVVEGLFSETDYYFALKAADAEPNWSALSNVAQARTWAAPDTIPPSAIEDLAASSPTDHSVILTWTAPGDDHHIGTAAQYDIRYCTSPITDANWDAATQAAAEPSPKSAGTQEMYVVTGLASKSTYYFALTTADERSNISSLSNVANAETRADYLWSPLGSGTNNIVNALAVFDGQLIAAGSFTTAGDVDAAHIASWNGSSWSPLGLGTNDAVYALTIYDGQLIAAGKFTTAGGSAANRIAAWNGSSWASLASGTNNRVNALTVYKGRLIAGGWFTSAGGTAANYTAAWNGSSWSALGSGMGGGYTPYTMALASYKDLLVAGGNFSTSGGVEANYIATWNDTAWAPLGSGANAFVVALTVYDNQLIAGGSFTEAGDAEANHVAAWNGSSWAPLGSGANDNVASLLAPDNQLIAGGWFSAAGEGPASCIAVWNGSSWSPLGTGISMPSPPPVVYALTVYGGRLIVGGWFTAAGGTFASNIAAWGD